MAEVLISVQRPASMTEDEMRAWFAERALAGEPALALGGLDGSQSHPLVLHVDVGSDTSRAIEEQLTDLMLDLRLLGLRPTVVAPRSHWPEDMGKEDR